MKYNRFVLMGPIWPIGGIMTQKFTVKTIVQTGLLLALEIVLQVIGNYVQIGPANINLSLVPVVLAGVLCGPISAAVLGFFNGILALLSPSTLAIFMPINPLATVLICLFKCTLAGLVSSVAYRLIRNKNQMMGLILASILVPVVNTGIFCLGSILFFRPFLESGVGEAFPNIGAFLIFGVIGWNFIIELVSTLILSPTLGTILLKREEKAQ